MPHGSLHPNSSSTPNATVDKRESGVKCTEAQNEDVLAGKFLHFNGGGDTPLRPGSSSKTRFDTGA